MARIGSKVKQGLGVEKGLSIVLYGGVLFGCCCCCLHAKRMSLSNKRESIR